MHSREVKLRRLARMKVRKRGKPKAWDHCALLYWRYWLQINKRHEHLWGKPKSNGKRKGK
jgi:hypothetical protein